MAAFKEFERKAKELKVLEKELGSIDQKCFSSETSEIRGMEYNAERKIDLDKISDIKNALENLKQKMEERKTTPLSISPSKKPESMVSGETSEMVFNIAYNGSLIPDAEVGLSAGRGELSPERGKTDKEGVFVSEYTAPAVIFEEIDEITVSVLKNCYKGAKSSFDMVILPPPPPPPPPQPITLKRTIWDPTNNKPITTSKEDKEFPVIRKTIEQLEKGNTLKHYWFVLCIANHTNKGISTFSVNFEAKDTLKILAVYVEGREMIKEGEIRDKIRQSGGSAYGFDKYSTKPISESIPPKESKRIYFKLSSDGCGIDYEIRNGRVELPDLDLISDKAAEIAPKSFHYSCEIPPEDESKEDLEEIEKWLEKTEKDKAARTDPDIRGLIIRRKGNFLSKLKENAEKQNVEDTLIYARLVNQHFENEPLSDVGHEALQELKTEITGRLEDSFKRDTSMLDSTMKRISIICTTIDETWEIDMLQGVGKNNRGGDKMRRE